MSTLKDELRRFVENMPETDEEVGKKVAPKGPNRTTYTGRPNWCGGALLREQNAEGEWVDKRTYCSDEAGSGLSLCKRCAGLEAQWRQKLRKSKDEGEKKKRVEKAAEETGVIAKRPALLTPGRKLV